MCLKEVTTSLDIIILDDAEAQEQLHGAVGGGIRCRDAQERACYWQ